jgi:hypothetical protein
VEQIETRSDIGRIIGIKTERIKMNIEELAEKLIEGYIHLIEHVGTMPSEVRTAAIEHSLRCVQNQRDLLHRMNLDDHLDSDYWDELRDIELYLKQV